MGKIGDMFKSKREKKHRELMSTVLNLEIQGENNEKENWKITIQEMTAEYVRLKQGMAMVNIFTQAMAVAFYKSCPDHNFFKGCDKKFMEMIMNIIQDGKKEDANVLKFPDKK